MRGEDGPSIREVRAEAWRRFLECRDDSDVSRRAFLRVMGASVGLAGLSACTRSTRNALLPYVDQVPEVTPGRPSFYATSMVMDGYAMGLLVESHEGRPTKIEGNPDHPDSLGATGPLQQAHVLSLYEPSRAREVLHERNPASWPEVVLAFANAGIEDGGAGMHFLLEPTSSPTLIDVIGRVRARLPRAEVHFASPVPRSSVWEGARIAFGRPLEPRVDLRRANVILVLGGDVLTEGPGFVPRARAFADGRRLQHAGDRMNRLYVAEAALTSTGALADHRILVRDHDLVALTAAIAAEVMSATPASGIPHEVQALFASWKDRVPEHARWIRATARDLVANRSASAVLACDRMPAEVHAIVHVMNVALGNVGHSVTFGESPIFEAGQSSHDGAALVRALEAESVRTLVILGGNPAYTSFADVDFARLAARAPVSLYLGPHVNETARACRWFVAEAHELESWGDARATDGTVSFVQPLLRRRHETRTTTEVLAVFSGDLAPDAYALLRSYWARARAELADETRFRALLARGLLEGTAFPSATAAIDQASLLRRLHALPPRDTNGLEIRFAVDPRIHDGRFDDNTWLLELPDPITSLTWDNAALMSATTAAKLGVATEQTIELSYRGRTLRAPVLVMPHADDSITLNLGYGHERAGDGDHPSRVGVNAYALRTQAAPWFDGGLSVRKVPGEHEFAFGQTEHALHGRDDEILMHRTLDEYRRAPEFTKDAKEAPRQLYLLAPDAERQWGMVVDLNACVGCNACVVACQAENNVPVVGKTGVKKGRRMHWLRLDRYEVESAGQKTLLPQPMLCQHCETAPCEYVCPVNATTHSSDGLNQMIYNRCVGTRFCSNNCPYKVRRFNWFDYNLDLSPLEQLVKNPDVTVRERGVMEKCTYCVQRIREHEIDASVHGRRLEPGEIQSACQQVCPARAISFGNLADPAAEVTRWARNERVFNVLNELGTRPRTRYLAKISNPNSELS